MPNFPPEPASSPGAFAPEGSTAPDRPEAIDPGWYRELVEAAPDAIVMVDGSGRIVLVNRRMEKLFGYAREEVLGQPVERLLPERLRGGHAERLRRYFADPRPREMGAGLDLWGQRKDGSEFPVEISLGPLATPQGMYAAAAIRDATDRRRAHDKFRGLLESAPDAMIIMGADGRIRLVNAQAERMFGGQREQLVGQPIEVLIPERLREVHEGHRRGYAADMALRPMGASLDLLARRLDGREFPVEISLSPLQTEEGPLVTAAVRDISQRKQVQQQLADYADSLARSNRELEQFAYVASHDLRAPLRSVIGFSQILQRRYAGRLDAEADEFLQYIVRSAGDMQSLIDGLLAFSRVARAGSDFGEVDLEYLLPRVLAQLRSTLEERRARVTHDPLPRVRGLEMELMQLLLNLVGNGIKFQPGEAPQVHLSAERAGGEWCLRVRDRGIGIDPRHHARIFQIFQRLHGSDDYDGTGIGLAICKKIVEHHGGRIWVESVPNEGATFLFTLPAA